MLRRLSLITFLLFSCLLASAQEDVQGTFWGIPFYASKNHVFRGFSDNAESSLRNRDSSDKLKFHNGYFAGEKWRFIEAEFYHDQFFLVSFSNNYASLESALECYSFFMNRLKKKYEGLLYEEFNNESDSSRTFWVYGNKRNCFLKLDYSESMGGEFYYYVSLMYYVPSVYSLKYESELDEL